MKLKELDLEPLVVLKRESSPVHYDRLMRCFRLTGVVPHIIQEAQNEDTMLSLVSVGMGVAVVTYAIPWRQPVGVLFKPVADLEVSTRMDLVWRRNSALPALARFVDTVRREFGSQRDLG